MNDCQDELPICPSAGTSKSWIQERTNRWGPDNPVRFVRSMGEIVLWNVEIKLQVSVAAVSLSPLCPADPGAALLKFGVSVWKVSAGPEAVLRSLPNGESLV